MTEIITKQEYVKKALIIFYKGKNILLQDRKKISKSGTEWGFFGGSLEEGETPEQAVVRETREELSFDLTNYKFVGMDKYEDDKKVVEKYFFISPLGELSDFKQMEGDNMQVFSLSEAVELKIAPSDKIIIKRLEELL